MIRVRPGPPPGLPRGRDPPSPQLPLPPLETEPHASRVDMWIAKATFSTKLTECIEKENMVRVKLDLSLLPYPTNRI